MALRISALAAQVFTVKNVIGATLILSGVAVTAVGLLKVPGQTAAIAAELAKHDTTSHILTSETNRKLDVLICLQAKLDTPIRCVAQGK